MLRISALDRRTDLDFYFITSAIWYVTMTAYHGLCFSFSKSRPPKQGVLVTQFL